MDNDKKLFEELLKADGINPAAITESERAVFKQMLDSEQQRMKRLCRRTNVTLWIFVLVMLGLCLSENILEALHIPFYVGCFVLGIAMFYVMIRYMPGHNRMMRESGSKISKLYYLVHGRHRGIILVGKKDGKRHIYWSRVIMISAVIWLAMSLGGAGVFYLLCGRWIYSSGPMLHIIYCTLPCLSLVIFVLRDGLKTPLDELPEIKSKPKQPKPGHRPDIWRMIMKNRITKLAAAAVIIIAALLVFNYFGIPIDGANIAFGKMAEAIEKTPWMHFTMQSSSQGKEDSTEHWYSFSSHLEIHTRPDGIITFHDYNKKERREYNPDLNTITYYCSPFNDFPAEAPGATTAEQFLEKMFKFWLRREKTIMTKHTGKYKGKKVQIYELTLSLPAEKTCQMKMVADNETDLPISAESKRFDKMGEIIGETKYVFDYPSNGPKNLYALGVPRNAMIDDRLPAKNVVQLLDIYESCRNNFTFAYIAVVTDDFFYEPTSTNIIYQVRVIYKDGKYQRVEYYGVPQEHLAGYYENWPAYKSQMGDSIESILSWWQESEIALLTQMDLYDGKFYYQLCRDDNLNWKSLPKVYSQKNDFRADDDIADLGWDVYLSASIANSADSSPLAVVENEYSKQHNLICLETKKQGQIITDSVGKVWAVAPSRKTYYLNPECDYICQRFEQEEKFDASWQEDTELINRIEQEAINKNPAINRVREVTEYGRTEQGLWYPKVIKNWNPSKASSSLRVKKVYLNSTSVFPESIFDHKALPK